MRRDGTGYGSLLAQRTHYLQSVPAHDMMDAVLEKGLAVAARPPGAMGGHRTDVIGYHIPR